jgi:fructose-1,6-bisphosphatase/inositol monophosphatase family enzyme
MWQAVRVYTQPWTAREPTTSMYKSTERSHDDDPTEAIDDAARVAITEVLSQAAETPMHPLSAGFLLHNEETGLHQVKGIGGAWGEEIIVFVDPIDYTSGAVRGLDGSSLISFYHRKQGLCVAVIGDLFRSRIFWRAAGETSKAMSIVPRDNPAAFFLSKVEHELLPTGDSLALTPTRRTQLRGSAVNIYMGKPERIAAANRLGGALWDSSTGIKEIFSVGGSLGPVRVAQGLWDASIEIAKGFRPWDFMPGAFIAEGAGASVVDLAGSSIDFGPGLIRDEFIKARFEGNSLEDCRQKFIVAATDQLARELVAKIGVGVRGPVGQESPVSSVNPTTSTPR